MKVIIEIPDDILPESGSVFIDDLYLCVCDRQVYQSNYNFENVDNIKNIIKDTAYEMFVKDTFLKEDEDDKI